MCILKGWVIEDFKICISDILYYSGFKSCSVNFTNIDKNMQWHKIKTKKNVKLFYIFYKDIIRLIKILAIDANILLYYESGIIDNVNCHGVAVDHAVLLVGFGEGRYFS